MKKLVLSMVAFATGLGMFAQDLPSNPEPGKCYVRCTTPDIYENQTVDIQVSPSYKVLRSVPATFKTVTEEVMVKDASKVLRVIPATYTTETVSYTSKQGGSTISISPATFGSDTQSIQIKPAYASWELGAPAANCASSNPDDCRYWCYKGYPAEYTTISITTLQNDATISRNPLDSKTGTYTKKVLATPARVVEEVIPAEYATITRTVVDQDAYTQEEVIPAKFRTITKEILKQKGGLTTWREVDCKLVEYSALPINWNTGSATLTATAKSLIDNRLMPVLASNEGAKMEVASHTDSRGSATSNQSLSERRAQSVVNYLISKGVNASRLVANGYGERRLKNRCTDGVSCTEREHAANRRTEFRLINN